MDLTGGLNWIFPGKLGMTFCCRKFFWEVLGYQLCCKARPCGEFSVVDFRNKCTRDWAEYGVVIIHCEIWLRGHGESVVR